MTVKEAFSVLAGLLCIIGYIPYVSSILRKETMPARATWLIWAFLDIITLAGMYAAGAINGQIIASFVGASTVGLLSLKYGKPGWSNIDKISIGGSVVGIILWVVFKNPTFGIVISLVVILWGSIPTFASALEDPNRENKTAWIIFFISCLFAIIAIPKWTLEDAAQPVTFLIIEMIMLYIIFRRSGSGVKAGKKIMAEI